VCEQRRGTGFCVGGGVSVAENTDVGFVLAKALDVAVKVWVVEVVVEHQYGDVDVREVVVLESVVFANAGDEPKFVGVGRPGMAVEKRDVVGLLGGEQFLFGPR